MGKKNKKKNRKEETEQKTIKETEKLEETRETSEAENSEKPAEIKLEPEIKEDVVLSFKNVKIDYEVSEGLVKSVDAVTFDVQAGKITAIIGESGSGKSTLTSAVLRVLAPNGKISSDSQILFRGQDILKMSDREVRNFRWRDASMVFQAAQNAMNPTLKIYNQIMDTVIDHGDDPNSQEVQDHL
ncbi:MAG: ATP-binding cassette domain-containing protein, partial [Vulcanimicrobiota bacterium]